MADPRYYVSVLDNGTYQLTELHDDKAVSYPLPEHIPGLAEQLTEWRKWRAVFVQAMRATEGEAPELAVVFADLLGRMLAESDHG